MILKRRDYKILVIGLGSMGKRRVRNLRAMGFSNIYGFDTRQDRSTEAAALYDIKTVTDVDSAIRDNKPEALIISVPPDVHHIYIRKAVESGIHFFVEASVVEEGMKDIISKLEGKKLIAAPSGT